jgi:hypothetical protein
MNWLKMETTPTVSKEEEFSMRIVKTEPIGITLVRDERRGGRRNIPASQTTLLKFEAL